MKKYIKLIFAAVALAFPVVQLGCSDAVGPVPPSQPIDYSNYPFTPGTLVQGTYSVSEITITRNAEGLDPEQLEYSIELSKFYLLSPRTVTEGNPFNLKFFLSVTETIVNTKYDVTITQETMLFGKEVTDSNASSGIFLFGPEQLGSYERGQELGKKFLYSDYDDGAGSGLNGEYNDFIAHMTLLIYPFGVTAKLSLSSGFSEWDPEEDNFPPQRSLYWKIEATMKRTSFLAAPRLACRPLQTHANLHYLAGETCRF